MLPQKPTVWTHIVLNYLGPNEGEGIAVYYNRPPERIDPTKHAKSRTAGDGRIVVGRHFTDKKSYTRPESTWMSSSFSIKRCLLITLTNCTSQCRL